MRYSRPMSNYEQQLHALDAREAFALAQGREDLLDVIDAERHALEAEAHRSRMDRLDNEAETR